MQRTAVIGAGLAGLSCARTLRRAGCYVDVFEQERVIGGRLGTLRLGLSSFDHGAQYLSARTDRFRAYINELAQTGYAAPWSPRLTGDDSTTGQLGSWYVGTPGMASVVRPLAESVRIHTSCRVHTIQRVDKGWYLWFEDQSSAGPFAAVAVAVPAREARLLLGRLPELANPLDRVRVSPCWTLVARLDGQVLNGQDVYSDMSQVIRWISRNNTKPGRSARGDHLVVQAAQSWSREAEDADAEVVAEELWAETSHVLGLPPIRPQQMAAHLWRHGIVESSLGESYLFSRNHMVGVAGDWCLGRLSEHAFESGALLGEMIVGALH
jgi:hypothetical protein